MKKQIFSSEDFKTISCDVDEQETVINIQRNKNEVSIYTSDNTMVTKLARVFEKSKDIGSWQCFETSQDTDGKITGYLFITNKKSISFRTGSARNISEEAREKSRERLRKARSKK